jgi:hypothetical protein
LSVQGCSSRCASPSAIRFLAVVADQRADTGHHAASHHQSIAAHRSADNPYWYHTTQYGNEDEALPVETAKHPGGAYIGISAPPYGMNGLVRSDLGLFWDWSPISEVDQGLSGLTSIAADTTGRSVVGPADGHSMATRTPFTT